MARIFERNTHKMVPLLFLGLILFHQLPGFAAVTVPALPHLQPPSLVQSVEEKASADAMTEALLLTKVADLMTSSGQFREALALYRNVLQILNGKLPPDFHTLADVTGEMAVCYVHTQQLEDAERYALLSLNYADKCSDFTAYDYAVACNNAAYIKHHIGKHDEARTFYRLAIGRLDGGGTVARVSAALIRVNLGDLEMNLNQREEALLQYQLALKNLLAETGARHPAVIELKAKVRKASMPGFSRKTQKAL